MEEESGVKWTLVVSMIMFLLSIWVGPVLYVGSYYPPRGSILFYVNRVDILLFAMTLMTATLFTSGFAKAVTYKSTIMLFIASMGVFFIAILSGLFL